MPQSLTIVMYHYVRDFERTRYPLIKGLSVGGFRRQLDYLSAHHSIVTMDHVLDSIDGDGDLPADAALLTFDDGYAEHFATVFPILHERGLTGAFFPPVEPVRNGVLLDVNRIHFILASAPSVAPLAEAVDLAVEQYAGEFDLRSVAEYRQEWAKPNRFDDADTIYVKRMLQTALPSILRERVARELFARFVTSDESAFAAELYLSEDQARLMVSCGMFFGSHGLSHRWLNRVDRETQIAEVEGSLGFLSDIGVPVGDGWVMCYPYGGYDDSLREVIAGRGCRLGLTTEVATASLGTNDPLVLPRFDTNDFPQ